MRMRNCTWLVLSIFMAVVASAQVATGTLQIHHIDIGQGDSAVMITPKGTVVLFDAGRELPKRSGFTRKDCSAEVDYLDQLGVKQIDYLFVSHYHYDHIECIPDVLKRFPLQHEAFDRGTEQSVPTQQTYKNYLKAVQGHETTATVDQIVSLDDGSDPVLLKVLVRSGKYDTQGDVVATKDENDLSLSVLVEYEGFREEIGGDLSGEGTTMYQDIESKVAPSLVPLDVYKVHHHCSSYSSNETWLKATVPTVAIISTGDGNDYNHPANDCLERLHEANISRVFWTEKGDATPDVNDVVGGDIVIEVKPNGHSFTVTYGGGKVETFAIKAHPGGALDAAIADATPTPPAHKYAWSVRADHYYDLGCPVVNRISASNLRSGDHPPEGKVFKECPSR